MSMPMSTRVAGLQLHTAQATRVSVTLSNTATHRGGDARRAIARAIGQGHEASVPDTRAANVVPHEPAPGIATLTTGTTSGTPQRATAIMAGRSRSSSRDFRHPVDRIRQHGAILAVSLVKGKRREGLSRM
jgi:hypothetical protein